MIFIVSDLHLGKRPETDTRSLQELEACIAASEARTVVFLGDVFDAFIESSHRPPESFNTWANLARRLINSGLTLHYVMGNHDRWHRHLVADIIGAPPTRGTKLLDWNGQTVHLEHGDNGQPHRLATRFARWFSDQKWVHSCFTLLLPFGGAQSVAAGVSRHFASFDPNPATVDALRQYAAKTIQSEDSVGIVMGHCHQPGLFDLTNDLARKAWYANSGDWFGSRSFVLLADTAQGDIPASVRLCVWKDGDVCEEATLGAI